MPKVSVVLVFFNDCVQLIKCLNSLFEQKFNDLEIVIVNNSPDVSLPFKENEHFKIVNLEASIGFGAANNRGYEKCSGDLIVFSNYDVQFESKWLELMVREIIENNDVGLISPKINLFNEKDRVNTIGLAVHFTGQAFSRGYRALASSYNEKIELPSITGCCFLIRRDIVEKIGLFDEEYHNFGEFFFSSLEDADLSFRVKLLGYRIVLCHNSIIYHKYVQKELTPLRYYYLECGRYYLLMKNFKPATIILLLPSLIFTELLIIGYIMMKGERFVRRKISSYIWLFMSLKMINKERKLIERNALDKSIIENMTKLTEVRHLCKFPLINKLITLLVNSVYFILYYPSIFLIKLMKL